MYLRMSARNCPAAHGMQSDLLHRGEKCIRSNNMDVTGRNTKLMFTCTVGINNHESVVYNFSLSTCTAALSKN
jgi:hypothetical protein